MMGHLLKDILGWLSREYIAIYRESDRCLVDAIIQTNTQINQIILAVSVACLTAIATLNHQVFRISTLVSLYFYSNIYHGYFAFYNKPLFIYKGVV